LSAQPRRIALHSAVTVRVSATLALRELGAGVATIRAAL